MGRLDGARSARETTSVGGSILALSHIRNNDISFRPNAKAGATLSLGKLNTSGSDFLPNPFCDDSGYSGVNDDLQVGSREDILGQVSRFGRDPFATFINISHFRFVRLQSQTGVISSLNVLICVYTLVSPF
jgi:hypothetical protein